MAYYEKFTQTQKAEELHTSLGYFDRRIALADTKMDYYEQRWFAMLKVK